MIYINSKNNGLVETIDQFETRAEAKEMIKEYRIAFGSSSHLYLSQRSTKEWDDKSRLEQWNVQKWTKALVKHGL